MNVERRVLTVKEASEVLGIGLNLAYKMVKEGRIPSLQFGRRTVIPVVELEALLKKTK